MSKHSIIEVGRWTEQSGPRYELHFRILDAELLPIRVEVNEEEGVEFGIGPDDNWAWPDAKTKTLYDNFVNSVLAHVRPRSIIVEEDDRVALSFFERLTDERRDFANEFVTDRLETFFGVSRSETKDLDSDYGKRLAEHRAKDAALDAEISGESVEDYEREDDLDALDQEKPADT